MKEHRADIRARIEGHGRTPDDCKVLFLVAPVVGEPVEEARERSWRWASDPNRIEYTRAEISSITEIDFSQFDLDQPLPEAQPSLRHRDHRRLGPGAAERRGLSRTAYTHEQFRDNLQEF